MRTVRWLAAGLALVALVPAAGEAQAGRLFKDSWFWGVKAGSMSFSTATSRNALAPMIGAEWLITRSRAALYVAGDAAFFDETSSITDPQGGATYQLEIGDMRRLSVAMLAFPVAYGSLRPYAGLGFSLNFIQRVSPTGTFGDSAQANRAQALAADQKDRASVLLMGGVQAQYRRLSIFGQASMLPSRERFLLNGRTTYVIEGGIRFNIGSAIEQP